VRKGANILIKIKAISSTIHSSEMKEVVADCDVWRLNLKLLPLQITWTWGFWKKKINNR